MCIAILNTSETLTFDTIKNSFDNNPDGAGFAYVKRGELVAHKETKLANVQAFYDAYTKARASTKLPIMLHFRIGTSGVKDERNLHPFFINRRLAMCHNGIIQIAQPEKQFSDTWHFAKFCRSFRDHSALLDAKSFEFEAVKSFVGSNKLIYLSASGAYSIVNEKLGHWDKSGNWYSNNTYEVCDWYNVGGVWESKNGGSVGYKTSSSVNYFDEYDPAYNWIEQYNYNEKLQLIDEATVGTRLARIKTGTQPETTIAHLNRLTRVYNVTTTRGVLEALYNDVSLYNDNKPADAGNDNEGAEWPAKLDAP